MELQCETIVGAFSIELDDMEIVPEAQFIRKIMRQSFKTYGFSPTITKGEFTSAYYEYIKILRNKKSGFNFEIV